MKDVLYRLCVLCYLPPNTTNLTNYAQEFVVISNIFSDSFIARFNFGPREAMGKYPPTHFPSERGGGGFCDRGNKRKDCGYQGEDTSPAAVESLF